MADDNNPTKTFPYGKPEEVKPAEPNSPSENPQPAPKPDEDAK